MLNELCPFSYLAYCRAEGIRIRHALPLLVWDLPPPIKLEKALNNLKCIDLTSIVIVLPYTPEFWRVLCF